MIQWYKVYEDPKLYADYKAMLNEAFVPRFGSIAEVENAIYYKLDPQLGKDRNVYKKPFASLDEMKTYLFTVLDNEAGAKTKQAKFVSLEQENDQGLTLKDCIEASPNSSEEKVYNSICKIVSDASYNKSPYEAIARLICADPLAGLTQKEMAKRLGCSQSKVSRAKQELIHQVNVGLER